MEGTFGRVRGELYGEVGSEFRGESLIKGAEAITGWRRALGPRRAGGTRMFFSSSSPSVHR